jgi:hypothetical protein
MGIVTFGHDGLILPTSLAAEALQQLNLMSVFAQAAMGGYGEGAFSYGKQVQFRRIQIANAQKYNPRSNVPATQQDIGYVTGYLNLDDLYTAGVPLYSSDYGMEKYLVEAGRAIAFSITMGFDVDLYNRFRTPTHASIGSVAYGTNMPLRIVANEVNGVFSPFNQQLLIRGGAAMESENVAPGDQFAIISTNAKADFLDSQTPVNAGAAYDRAGVTNLVQNGLPINRFVERMGFQVGSSNVIAANGLQTATADLDTVAGSSPTLAIASAFADTTLFFKADYAVSTALGAVALTLTCTGLQNVAVGQIARVANSGNVTIAYGIVLRVDTLNKQVWLVPYAPNGTLLTSVDLSASGATFSIPTVPSVNVGYKKSALIYDTRQMEAPPEGAGATMVGAKDDQSGLMLQIWQGGYDVNQFKSSMRYSLLSGSTFNDYRCGVFMLSA